MFKTGDEKVEHTKSFHGAIRKWKLSSHYSELFPQPKNGYKCIYALNLTPLPIINYYLSYTS